MLRSLARLVIMGWAVVASIGCANSNLGSTLAQNSAEADEAQDADCATTPDECPSASEFSPAIRALRVLYNLAGNRAPVPKSKVAPAEIEELKGIITKAEELHSENETGVVPHNLTVGRLKLLDQGKARVEVSSTNEIMLDVQVVRELLESAVVNEFGSFAEYAQVAFKLLQKDRVDVEKLEFNISGRLVAVDGAFLNALKFIILHERAHIALGHTMRLSQSGNETTCAQFVQFEHEADAAAFDVAFRQKGRSEVIVSLLADSRFAEADDEMERSLRSYLSERPGRELAFLKTPKLHSRKMFNAACSYPTPQERMNRLDGVRSSKIDPKVKEFFGSN